MANPTDKGVLIWQLRNCGPNWPQLALSLLQGGFSWVGIKAANGPNDYNAAELPTVVPVLRGAGLQVWGWQYVYGAAVSTGVSIARQEAEAAIRNIQRYSLTGWLIDAEGEYKRPGAAAWADTYMTTLRGSLPNYPFGLCSYRFPSLHSQLPWQNFLRRCDFHAPMVYWIGYHNPGQQLRRSVTELRAQRDLPIVPVGAAYTEHGWRPTINDLNEFNQTAIDLGLPGVSWWAWDDSGGLKYSPDFLAAITAHQWGTPPPPPPPPPPQTWTQALDAWARTMGFNGPPPPTG